MASLSRREFIQTAAGGIVMAGGLAVGVTALRASPLGLPIGSQTWPHRAMIREGNFPALLTTLKDIGVDAIELCSPGCGRSSPTTASTVRVVTSPLRELRERQADSLAWATDAGITQIWRSPSVSRCAPDR